jgi:hypothetical protein
MHVAIDDTYGPDAATPSRYVTGKRRTHVAVIFPDGEVDNIRQQVRNCLQFASLEFAREVTEFHFVDIYNRNPPWDTLEDHVNLDFFGAFCSIYAQYRWPVVIFTVDDRTISDHPSLKSGGMVDGLDPGKRDDLALLLLCLKLKLLHKTTGEPLHLYVDEGRGKPGREFGSQIFHDWPAQYSGAYASSKAEPLLQIADLIAFCINRSTHLQTKSKRTAVDNWFLRLMSRMAINSPDLRPTRHSSNFGVNDFDEQHRLDRIEKGLEE